jgi:hypothetical protein
VCIAKLIARCAGPNVIELANPTFDLTSQYFESTRTAISPISRPHLELKFVQGVSSFRRYSADGRIFDAEKALGEAQNNVNFSDRDADELTRKE